MKKISLFVTMTALSILSMEGQSKKEKDIKAIKSMCGCYEVSFNFAETFNYAQNEDYVPSKTKHDTGLEWVQPVEDGADRIVMQHLLLVGPPNAKKVIKHWRQDWLFENTDLYTYHADNLWKYESLEKSDVAGQWTQKVYQVDDSPRYEGSATWVHVDGQSSWENTTDAPLPRREYTKRDDYNVTQRTNKHALTDQGWIHDQDNKKIIRTEGADDVVLAEEKGLNIYRKVADERCATAQSWWTENADEWVAVREKWDEVFSRKKDLKAISRLR